MLIVSPFGKLKRHWVSVRDLFDRTPGLKHLALLLPLLLVPTLVVIFGQILKHAYGVWLLDSGYRADIYLGIAVGYWLFFLLRPWWAYLLVQVLITGTLYIANALKIDYFNSPVMPSDLAALAALLDQLSGWRYLLVLVPLVAVAVAFVAGLRWRWQTPVLLLAGVAVIYGGVHMSALTITTKLDDRYHYIANGDTLNLARRGPYLYLVGEYARSVALVGSPPSRAEVTAALATVNPHVPFAPTAPLKAPRDIYVFMMETLWDPSLLTAAHFSRDPFAPAYRALWEQAGESKSMVPVFGRGTPNSEFEVLCGEPAYDWGTVFESGMHRSTFCLPQLLAHMGYRTDAITPDTYGVWDRGDALRSVGFERFYDDQNLDANDQNGDFLSDQSLFEQTDRLLSTEGWSGPRLTYISTDSGHYPYELNTLKRPAQITSRSANSLVTAYANVVYYDTGELAAYIQQIRLRDPNAIIVAFGDHLPILNSNLSDYAQSNLMTGNPINFTPVMQETHQSTPLLVIDGKRGPLKLGHISLFEMPHLLLSLLGVTDPTLFDVFLPPAHIHLRPGNHHLLVVPEAGAPEFCDDAPVSGLCRQADLWDKNMQTLRADQLAGSRYAMESLYPTGTNVLDALDSHIDYLSKESGQPSCDIKVLGWGPEATTWGDKFNVLPDGSSSFSMTYTGNAEDLHAWLDSTPLHVVGTAGALRLSLHSRFPLLVPGTHRLTVACNDNPAQIEVGSFRVRL